MVRHNPGVYGRITHNSLQTWLKRKVINNEGIIVLPKKIRRIWLIEPLHYNYPYLDSYPLKRRNIGKKLMHKQTGLLARRVLKCWIKGLEGISMPHVEAELAKNQHPTISRSDAGGGWSCPELVGRNTPPSLPKIRTFLVIGRISFAAASIICKSLWPLRPYQLYPDSSAK